MRIECSTDGCVHEAQAVGLCKRCYHKLYKGTRTKPCGFDGCVRLAWAKGLCTYHYEKQRRHGDAGYERPAFVVVRCSMKRCEHDAVAKGLCRKHYFKQYSAARAKMQKPPVVAAKPNLAKERTYQSQPDQCTMPECESKAIARGLCRLHYNRWWKHGDPTAIRIAMGAQCRSTKISAEDAMKIKALIEQGVAQAVIARTFGLSTAAVHHIKTGKNWSWLEE